MRKISHKIACGETLHKTRASCFPRFPPYSYDSSELKNAEQRLSQPALSRGSNLYIYTNLMSANEEIGNSRQPQSEKTNKPGAMIGGAILGASLGGMPGALIGSVVGGVLGIILDDDSEGGSQ